MPYGYIYLIINLWNNKKYVGQSTRMQAIHMLNYFGSGKVIEIKIKTHGKRLFKKIILGYCYSQEELNKCEEETIDFFQCTNKLYGYNIRENSTFNSSEIHPAEESNVKRAKTLQNYWKSDIGIQRKQKLSITLTGKNNPMFEISPKQRILNKHGKIDGETKYKQFVDLLREKCPHPSSETTKQKISEKISADWNDQTQRKKRMKALLNSNNPWKPRADVTFEKIVELVKLGKTLIEIQTQLKCSSECIRKRLHNHGFKRIRDLRKQKNNSN